MKKIREQQAAVAIGYDTNANAAPKVLAAGYGEVAKAILNLAQENNIHIHNDTQLAQLLAQVPVGQEIPEEAYQLVAELLAFLYNMDQKIGKSTRP